MKNKTYIKIFAGLGNQIFQYIYGKKLELQGIKVRYILSSSKNDLTDIFEIEDKKKIYAPKGHLKQIKIILKKIWAKYIIQSFQTGFYQESNIIDYVNKTQPISSILNFKNINVYKNTKLFHKILDEKNSVSLHIRGGDYLESNKNNPFINVCTNTYYKNAIEYFSKIPNSSFFIFTNDISYAEKICSPFQKLKITYIYKENDCPTLKNDPGYDLFLMSQCKHNIIANSTFSWWGAYLNQNPQKKILYPENWLNQNATEIEINTASKIIPNDDNWISIKN